MTKKEELLKRKAKKLETIEGVRSNLKAGEATIKTLEKEVEELDAELKKLSGRAEHEGKYHYIFLATVGAEVETTKDTRHRVDNNRLNIGNYFLSEDEALEFADYTNFRLKAKKWMRENDPDFKPDWTDSHQDKYYAFYSGMSDTLEIDSVNRAHDTGMFYFSSAKIAREFRDEFANELKRGY